MDLDDQCPKPRATGGIGGDPEQSLGIRRLSQHQRIGVAAQLDQARSMNRPSAPFRLIGAKPENGRPAANGPKREHGRETRCTRAIAEVRGIKLMHPSAGEPAAQCTIENRMSGGGPLVCGQQPASGNGGQILPEHGKMINRLAQCLFLICSQLRFDRARVKQVATGEPRDSQVVGPASCLCDEREIGRLVSIRDQ